jgi:AcrR family transcriptional regulator
MDASSATRSRSRNGVTDKRAALLGAATELFAREGLQRVTTADIARAAGVAKGTLFVYFETKERLLNELYLEIVTDSIHALEAVLDPMDPPEALFRSYWFGFARWYFDHPDAATVSLQCEISAVLTLETLARKDAMEVDLSRTYFQGILERMEGTSWRYVSYAFIAGPIQVLAQIRDKGEIEIEDDLLEEVFARVRKVIVMTPP